MPHLFSRFHRSTKSTHEPQSTTLQLTKSAPSTTQANNNSTTNPLQPLAKNRTVGPEVSKMREWDWAETKRKDSGTGAAFLEDVRLGGTASPKSSIAQGAGGLAAAPLSGGITGILKKSSLSQGSDETL